MAFLFLPGISKIVALRKGSERPRLFGGMRMVGPPSLLVGRNGGLFMDEQLARIFGVFAIFAVFFCFFIWPVFFSDKYADKNKK
jgi:hypothetical protein